MAATPRRSTMRWRASTRRPSTLQLHGVGQFGGKQPHALWAAARKNEALEHLQRKVDTAIRRVGQPQDAAQIHARMSPWRGCAIRNRARCWNG